MYPIDLNFAERTGMTLIKWQTGEIERGLTRFYDSVEKAAGPPDDYSGCGLDVGLGDSVRLCFKRHLAGRGFSDFHVFGLVLQHMPGHWSPRYRGSVAYFLAPLAAYYFHDPGTVEHEVSNAARRRVNMPVFGG